MNRRRISPADIEGALSKPARVYINEQSGNDVWVGGNGVIVVIDPATEEVVSVFRLGDR